MLTFLRATLQRTPDRPFLPAVLGRPRLSSQCAVCRSWPAGPVCHACVARFAVPKRRCIHCAISLATDLSQGLRTGAAICASCIRHSPDTDTTLAAVSYAYPWSTLIGRYKFADEHGWAAFFATLLLRAPGVGEALDALGAEDWVVPMPLSAQRLETRGFNQAWALATALARAAGSRGRCDAGLLLRVRHTLPQSQLQRQARLANVKGAFQLDPLRSAEMRGRRVVLVDDVMTSGASLFTAARALREAGAAHITAVVLARTESPR